MHENHFDLLYHCISWQSLCFSHSQNIRHHFYREFYLHFSDAFPFFKKIIIIIIHKRMIHGIHDQCRWTLRSVVIHCIQQICELSNFWYIYATVSVHIKLLAEPFTFYFNFPSEKENWTNRIVHQSIFQLILCVLFILCVCAVFSDYTMQTMLRTSPVERNEWIKFTRMHLPIYARVCVCGWLDGCLFVCLYVCQGRWLLCLV